MKDQEFSAQGYSPVVADHMRNPRHWGIMRHSDGYAKITGTCGDTMEISLNVKNNLIAKCTFDTDGCGATVACGSMVAEMATGKPLTIARQIDQNMILDYCGGLPEGNTHCALLAANTLRRAIDDCVQTRKTPWKRFYRMEK
ncbi:MAG: iron-sulfur cluster assembly scaffold protein [candidate division WOR-3 bacterium]|nr:iron-sulfur cluster assembly scaffold protein [candidate division WOR-3 bacterium]